MKILIRNKKENKIFGLSNILEKEDAQARLGIKPETGWLPIFGAAKEYQGRDENEFPYTYTPHSNVPTATKVESVVIDEITWNDSYSIYSVPLKNNNILIFRSYKTKPDVAEELISSVSLIDGQYLVGVEVTPAEFETLQHEDEFEVKIDAAIDNRITYQPAPVAEVGFTTLPPHTQILRSSLSNPFGITPPITAVKSFDDHSDTTSDDEDANFIPTPPSSAPNSSSDEEGYFVGGVEIPRPDGYNSSAEEVSLNWDNDPLSILEDNIPVNKIHAQESFKEKIARIKSDVKYNQNGGKKHTADEEKEVKYFNVKEYKGGRISYINKHGLQVHIEKKFGGGYVKTVGVGANIDGTVVNVLGTKQSNLLFKHSFGAKLKYTNDELAAIGAASSKGDVAGKLEGKYDEFKDPRLANTTPFYTQNIVDAHDSTPVETPEYWDAATAQAWQDVHVATAFKHDFNEPTKVLNPYAVEELIINPQIGTRISDTQRLPAPNLLQFTGRPVTSTQPLDDFLATLPEPAPQIQLERTIAHLE